VEDALKPETREEEEEEEAILEKEVTKLSNFKDHL